MTDGSAARTVYYASIGPALAWFDLDAEAATLTRRGAVTLPANVQYAWPHRSRRTLYVVSSNGGPGIAGDTHFAHALSIEPATGGLRFFGEPARLPSRPIHVSVDGGGDYLLAAYNNPSNLTVHRLNADGTIGTAVAQAATLDTGIYAHQIRTTPDNSVVTLVTRGNNAGAGRPEDPGALKTFRFQDGKLTNLASIAPGNGLGFGPRHLDFHPTQPWAFVSIERQNELYVYRLDPDSGLDRQAAFVKDTLTDPHTQASQGAGAIHVHPNGRFVYLTNRTFPATHEGKREASADGEDSVAVFAIDPLSGEPKLIQNIDGHGIQLRTFGIDPGGRILIAASIMPRHEGDGSRTPAGMTVFRIAADGRLGFVRKYDVDVGAAEQFWSGMVTLA